MKNNYDKVNISALCNACGKESKINKTNILGESESLTDSIKDYMKLTNDIRVLMYNCLECYSTKVICQDLTTEQWFYPPE